MSNYLLFRGNFTKSKLIENELIANGIFPIVIDRKQSAILSGFGVNPIPYSEILSLFQLLRYEPQSWELEMIELFDEVAMEEYSKEMKKEQKKSSKSKQ